MSEKPHTKFSELNNSQKVEYIGDYYKIHIIVGACIVLFIGWMLNHYIFNPPAETSIDVSIFGISSNIDYQYALEDELNEYVIDEGVNEKVLVDFMSVSLEADPTSQQATMAKMVAKATINDYDIMIFNEDSYLNFLMEDALMPLNDFIDRGIIDVDESRLVKGSDVGYDSEDYYFVDISDHEGFENMLPYDDKLYLSVNFKANPMDQLERAIEYILME